MPTALPRTCKRPFCDVSDGWLSAASRIATFATFLTGIDSFAFTGVRCRSLLYILLYANLPPPSSIKLIACSAGLFVVRTKFFGGPGSATATFTLGGTELLPGRAAKSVRGGKRFFPFFFGGSSTWRGATCMTTLRGTVSYASGMMGHGLTNGGAKKGTPGAFEPALDFLVGAPNRDMKN